MSFLVSMIKRLKYPCLRPSIICNYDTAVANS